MSSGTFVDRIDPFAKRSLKKKSKKSQGSSRYRTTNDVELQPLPLLKGKYLLQLLITLPSSLRGPRNLTCTAVVSHVDGISACTV